MSASEQGYLAHNKPRPPRILQQDYAWGPTVVLGGRAVFHERGAPVAFASEPEYMSGYLSLPCGVRVLSLVPAQTQSRWGVMVPNRVTGVPRP